MYCLLIIAIKRSMSSYKKNQIKLQNIINNLIYTT